METDELGRLASIGGRRSLDGWRQTTAGVLSTAGARGIGWRTLDGWRQSTAGVLSAVDELSTADVLSTAGVLSAVDELSTAGRQAEQNQDGSNCRN